MLIVRRPDRLSTGPFVWRCRISDVITTRLLLALCKRGRVRKGKAFKRWWRCDDKLPSLKSTVANVLRFRRQRICCSEDKQLSAGTIAACAGSEFTRSLQWGDAGNPELESKNSGARTYPGRPSLWSPTSPCCALRGGTRSRWGRRLNFGSRCSAPRLPNATHALCLALSTSRLPSFSLRATVTNFTDVNPKTLIYRQH